MIITCPACDAQYLLPDEAIGSKGRRLKCTSCAHVWVQMPEEDFQAEPVKTVDDDAVLSAFAADENPAEEIVPPKNASVGQLALCIAGGTIAALLLTVFFSMAIRHSIVTWWPPMALYYETLGFPAPAPGANLELKDLKVAVSSTLDIIGKLGNPGTKEEFLPTLRVQLNGESGVLKHWDIPLYGKTLMPGKDASFQYTLKEPPQGGQSVTLLFVD